MSFLFRYKKILYGTLGFFGVVVISTTLVRAFIANDFSYTGTGHTSAFAGESNILLADFTGPAPATDLTLWDGASTDPVAGDVLTAFGEFDKFLDTDDEAGYGGGEPIIDSANDALEPTDTVLTSSTTAVLTAFPTTESGRSLYGYIDANSDSELSGGEDVLRQLVSGNAETLTSGDALRVLTSGDNVFYIADAGVSTYNDQAPSMIIHNTGIGDNSYVMLQQGTMNFRPITNSDNVCNEDSDQSGDISSGDDFWRDLNGTDCSSFDTGVDVILNGSGGVSDPWLYELTGFEAGSGYGDITPGYIDGNGDGVYNCSRASCEAFVMASGNVAIGGTSAFVLILTPSDALTDGINVTGTDWSEDPTLMNAYDLSTYTLNDEPRFTYIDSDASTTYDSNEDIVETMTSGADDIVSTGDLFTNMNNTGRYADIDSNGSYSVESDVLVSSFDANLDAGALDGTGNDEVIIESQNGTDLSMFNSQTMFFDADTSTEYEDGEDIVFDVDSSGYFNADDLESISFINTVSDYPVTDSDIAYLRVYKKTDFICGGYGADVLLGSLGEGPFFNEPISIADDVFTEATDYCVYADIDVGAEAGRYATLAIPQDGATFAGSIDSPSDDLFTMGDDNSYTSVARLMDSTIVPSSVLANATTTYTATFTTSADLTSTDRVSVVFPDEYDVTGAGITCTDDGVTVESVAVVDAQTVVATISDNILAGSVVVCTMTSIVNPETPAPYSSFIVATVRQAEANRIRADVCHTFSAVTITESAIKHNRKKIAEPTAPGVIITSPASGSSIKDAVTITWEDTGTTPGFANIIYIVGGEEHLIARNINDTGHYLWKIPSHLLGADVDIKVELTDLSTAQASAIVSVTVGDDAPVGEEEVPPLDLDSKWYMPDIGTRLVKIPESPIVYYVGYDHRLLRPFLTEDIFYSWHSNFDKIRDPEPVELAQFPIGAPMPPMPGTYLIKSPEDAKVYVMEPVKTNKTQPILHWIGSEDVAKAFFGDSWSKRVLDVPTSVIDLSPKGYDLVDTVTEPWFVSIYFK